ncbi:Na+/H+ antiporter [Ancylobacter rudongensis]|uniref:Monovalent cation:H+ antiporter, CPA1 family n=1 Tax=Ancylobacter rudongensis TaxID=177413 RepID=A0A1G4RGK0_9HYPH|nr:Na+/H+ antiporter [Ancylobacter rudongensis]SCW55857.1 monovalent cation:H+ antiporter, CPA1 family [Ancylobacter rudongensis]
MHHFYIVLVLLLGVVVSHWIAGTLRDRVALPLVQIALGAALGRVGPFSVTLDPALFFLLFLPPLLFLDGWRVPTEDLLDNAGTVLSLAFGLVFFTVLGIGYPLHVLVPAMPLPVCFALAAVVSPTDVVAAGAMVANVPVPRRMLRILQGEALFNDASGLVCLRLAVAATVTGTFHFWDALAELAWTAIGGVLIGAALTWAVSGAKTWVSSQLGEVTSTQIIISLLVPYGAYLIADGAGCSAVLAAVSAGMVMSRLEVRGITLPMTRLRRTTVWETLQFTLNGIIFLLLGEQLPNVLANINASVAEDGHRSLAWLAGCITLITVALALLRFVWVTAIIRLRRPGGDAIGGDAIGPRPNWRLVAAMSVAGVRGAVTLAGAMSIPLTGYDGTAFPARDLVIVLAAGVIVTSLVLANLALPRLLRGVTSPLEPDGSKAALEARIQATQAALAAVATAGAERANPQTGFIAAAARVTGDYQRRLEHLSGHAEAAPKDDRGEMEQARQDERALRLLALRAERAAVIGMARKRHISNDLARTLMRETDLAETYYLSPPETA